MTKLRKLILAGLATAGLGLAAGTVSAHPDACSHAGFNKEKFMEHMQKREARLHDQLKLSAAQEPAWKAFIAKVKPAPGEMPNHEERADLKAPERMERMVERMQQRAGRMTERVAAVKEFYAVLTPAQQNVFDANFMAGRKGSGGHRK